MVKLEIYIKRGCSFCRKSRQLAENIRRRFPEVTVQVVDLASEPGWHPDLVVATPTFVLNDRLFSLGNPSEPELASAISGLLGKEVNHEEAH